MNEQQIVWALVALAAWLYRGKIFALLGGKTSTAVVSVAGESDLVADATALFQRIHEMTDAKARNKVFREAAEALVNSKAATFSATMTPPAPAPAEAPVPNP